METKVRKQYLRPGMERVWMDMEEMIQASPGGLPSSPGTPGISGAQMREIQDDADASELKESLW